LRENKETNKTNSENKDNINSLISEKELNVVLESDENIEFKEERNDSINQDLHFSENFGYKKLGITYIFFTLILYIILYIGFFLMLFGTIGFYFLDLFVILYIAGRLLFNITNISILLKNYSIYKKNILYLLIISIVIIIISIFCDIILYIFPLLSESNRTDPNQMRRNIFIYKFLIDSAYSFITCIYLFILEIYFVYYR
jgi:hypothetical protein